MFPQGWMQEKIRFGDIGLRMRVVAYNGHVADSFVH